MSFWTQVKKHCADAVDEFDGEPADVTISPKLGTRPKLSTLEVSPTWYEHRDSELIMPGVNVRKDLEMPQSSPFNISDGAIYEKALSRIADIGSHVHLKHGARIHEPTLFSSNHGELADWNRLRRLHITVKEPIDDQRVVADGQEFTAEQTTSIDPNLTIGDVISFKATYSDFAVREPTSFRAKVVTTKPHNFHPNVESMDEMADVVSNTAKEHNQILNSEQFATAYLGTKDDVHPEGAEIAKRALDRVVDEYVNVDVPFAIEGESLQVNIRQLPSNAYDVMNGVAECDRTSTGALRIGFWLLLPPMSEV